MQKGRVIEKEKEREEIKQNKKKINKPKLLK